MITRDSLIYSEVRRWLTANQLTLKWLAREIEISYPTMMAVLTGRTRINTEVPKRIVGVIGFNPWEKYPAIPYPEDKEVT
jgi:hypothetical protein